MRKLVAASGLALIGAATATAAELPTRKAGLWQITMSLGGIGGQSIEQCVDAATDQMLQSNAGPFAQGACAKRDIERSGNRTVVEFDLHGRRQDRNRPCGHHRRLQQRLYDDGHLAERCFAGRRNEHDA